MNRHTHIHTYRQTDRLTDDRKTYRQTDQQRERQTDRKTGRHADKEIYRLACMHGGRQIDRDRQTDVQTNGRMDGGIIGRTDRQTYRLGKNIDCFLQNSS